MTKDFPNESDLNPCVQSNRFDFHKIDLQWFAAEDEGRTEEPTEYKLRKAREEGRVAKSQELNSALVLLVTVIILIIAARFYLSWCEEILVYYFTRCAENDVEQRQFFSTFLIYLLKMILPLALAGITAAFASNIIQNRGFLFSTKPIEPQFSKVAPKIGQYLKKTMFSFEGGFNILKSLFKISAIAVAAYIIISANLPVIMEFINAYSVRLAASKIASTAAQILITCAILFLVISVPDYIVQRRQFIESMKMTKQEVKQEYKEMEGDPEVKSHLEQAQRDLLRKNMPKAVAESDVVVTNPTHFAVALKYDAAIADSPQITAKGADEAAFRIKQIAKENNVPIIENRPLARSLYADTDVGDIIPEAYFYAVIEIYKQIDYYNKKM